MEDTGYEEFITDSGEYDIEDDYLNEPDAMEISKEKRLEKD